jgi:hypothetical protein
MAELVTDATQVLLSRIVQPVILRQHCFYVLATEAGSFTSIAAPTVLDQAGEPMRLFAELPRGSIVRVHAEDRYLRTVMVISVRPTTNPFA